MTIDTYRNFTAIVDCGSISAASKKLLVAQPSLSSQLQNLEKTYGKQLLIRGRGPLQLTPAGEIFYAKAKEICRLADSISYEMENEKTMFDETLVLTMPAGNTARFLHKLFDHFIETHPAVNFDFYEVPNDFMVPNILNDVSEIGLMRASIPQYTALAVYPYQREEIVAVFPDGHPLSHDEGLLEIHDLTKFPLAVPFDCLDIVHTVFGHHLVSPNIAVITSPRTTAVEWARSFGAVALISMTDDDTELTQGMKRRKFKDENMYLYSSFLIHKGRKLSQPAIDFLSEHINLNFSDNQ